MSASWDPPGVTHDLLEYLKAESIREESVWGGVRNRSEAQNGVSDPPTYLRMSVCVRDAHRHLLSCMPKSRGTKGVLCHQFARGEQYM